MIRFQITLSLLVLTGWNATRAQGQEPPLPEKIERPSLAPAPPTSLIPSPTINASPAFGLIPTIISTVDAVEQAFGLKLADADEALRSQLGLPGGQGVVVVAVKPGSLSEHAGLKTNDVFVSIDDQRCSNSASVKKTLLSMGKEAVELKLIREGKLSRMKLVGPDYGYLAESVQYWIGVPVSPVDVTLRAHLPLLIADAGLIANDVVKDSPADAGGVRKYDILVSMGGRPLKTSDHLIEQIQASAGKTVALEFLRAGKLGTLNITPAKRSFPTIINLKTSRDVQHFYFAPQLGVEISPVPTKPGVAFLGSSPNVVNNPQTWDWAIPYDLQLQLRGAPVKVDNPTSRVEAQLVELSAKLDEIRRLLEGMKKPVEK